MNEQSFNRITVDSAALEHNFGCIQKLAGFDRPVMAMVKGDGYGHGMVDAARAFSRAGCKVFGVAELREGVLLRKSGLKGDVYVTIGFDPEEAPLFFEYDLVPVVYNFESVLALASYADSIGTKIRVHIKVDTGMSRLGLLPDELRPFLDRIASLGAIEVAGVMSHFPEADIPDTASTLAAMAKFTHVCGEMKKRLGGICHIANSGAVINFPNAHCDMVRAGIALYGYHPAGSYYAIPKEIGVLRPAMSFKSKILQVKELASGTGVSYGHTFVTERSTKIAIIPVGYEDGYSRHLSNKGRVIINGRWASIRGRVCMNLCMVEVTHIEGVQAGDDVILLGDQGGLVISADDIAESVGSISYEVLCMLGNNNLREYQKG